MSRRQKSNCFARGEVLRVRILYLTRMIQERVYIRREREGLRKARKPLSGRRSRHPSRHARGLWDKTTALLWITRGAIYSRRRSESTCSFLEEKMVRCSRPGGYSNHPLCFISFSLSPLLLGFRWRYSVLRRRCGNWILLRPRVYERIHICTSFTSNTLFRFSTGTRSPSK